VATLIVKDTAGLTAALKSAQAGDTIKLAAGDYAQFNLSGVKVAGEGVVVTSLDPANQAKLNGFMLGDCSGITFRDLELKSASTAVNPYQILKSTQITLDKLDIHGSLDGNPQNDGGGVLIRESSKVTVTNSEFHELNYGVAHVDTQGVTIDGNNFHEIQEDGVRGGGSSQIAVTNNLFSNFAPVGGDHPDAIQFWTSLTKASAVDITVSGNLVLRGEGSAIQGIFFRDQVGTLPYKNVVITDNLVVGGMANGIMVNGADGVKISGNTIAALADQNSGIGLTKVTNVMLTDNKASQFAFVTTTISNVTNVNGVVLAPVVDGGASLVETFLATHQKVLQLATMQELLDHVADGLAAIEAIRVDARVVTGTAGNDVLKTLVDRDTRVEGGAGNDVLDSVGVGHNTLDGGAGDDTYRLTSTYDVVVELAGGGMDHVSSSVNVTLSDNVEKLTLTGGARVGVGNSLANNISGSIGGDTISGMGGGDNIQANDGDDFVSGGEGADGLYGGNGNDTLTGDGGADRLRGDGGNDSLSGGAEADTLEGSAGQDSLAGGVGADQFVMSNLEPIGEVIFDFSRADGDKVILTAVDSNSVLTGNQAFAFIGTGAFTKVAGQLRYEVSGSDSYVMGDYNGDGVADFKLLMKNITSLQSSDFML